MMRIPNKFFSFAHKIKVHWNHYQACHPRQKFLLFNYLFWVIFYRRFICYVIAIPLFLLYWLVYPFIKIRFVKLIGGVIGHYAASTELLLCKLDTFKDDKFTNIFYLENSLFEPTICNEQLHKMWKRIIFILPAQFSGIIRCLDQLLMLFLTKKAYDLWGYKKIYEQRWSRDQDGFLESTPSHLSFTEKEHLQAKEILSTMNVDTNAKYVCLLVRTKDFNQGHPTWNYDERNAELSTYIKACLFLANKGYYVFRMGKNAHESFEVSHPRVIDYAKSSIRSDFMDIYLSANCFFYISTGTGLDQIAFIFRRPVLITNFFVLPFIGTWFPNYLFIPKNWLNTKTNKLLSFKEQIDLFYSHPELSMSTVYKLQEHIKKYGLLFKNNSEDEILAVVIEMEARLTKTWGESNEDIKLQTEFWKLFSKYIQTIVTLNKTLSFNGNIFAKIGANFLRNNRHLLQKE